MNNETQQQAGTRRGVLSAVIYFAGVALLVAGLMLVLPGSDGEQGSEAAAAPEESTTTTSTVPIVAVEAPNFVQGEEPIADAAEVILPSVVHIETSSGLGAGVIYSADGLIVTAAHVVDGDETVRIRFDNGDQAQGTVLGARTGVDIAVIKVDLEGLTPAVFAEGKPRVGQTAIAVGSPWGLESTVTAGIVSAVDQTNCDFDACFSMVQTDAAINPGNSGGPLVDRHGQVIGINVSIRTESGANDGVGFAVPADVVIAQAESIVSGEPIETAFLGVQGSNTTEGQAGALITVVTADSGADEAGVLVGDVVVSIDGVSVQGIADLAAQVRKHNPGDTAELVLLRDGEQLTLTVTLGLRAPEESS